MSDTSIYVTFSLEGFHQWSEAPDEVSFLRSRHRHMFHYKAMLSVEHDDREVEFFILQRKLIAFCVGITNDKSCEMLARDLVDYMKASYPNRSIMVSVSEDGENGAIVNFEPGPEKASLVSSLASALKKSFRGFTEGIVFMGR